VNLGDATQAAQHRAHRPRCRRRLRRADAGGAAGHRVAGVAGLDPRQPVRRDLRRARHGGPRERASGHPHPPPGRGAAAAQPRPAGHGLHAGHRPAHAGPQQAACGERQPRPVPAAERRREGERAGRARRPHAGNAARDRLDRARQQRFLPRLATVGGRRHVPPPLRSAGLRQRSAAGIHRAEKAQRAAEERLRRQPARLPRAEHPATVPPQRLHSAEQRQRHARGYADQHLGAFFRLEAGGRRGRSARPECRHGEPGARTARPAGPGAAARLHRELHRVRGGQGRAGEEDREKPPVARREPGHRAAAGLARQRTSRAQASGCVLAHPGFRQEPVDGVFHAEGAAQGAGQLHVRDRDRPRGTGRADQQDLQKPPAPPRARTCAPPAASI